MPRRKPEPFVKLHKDGSRLRSGYFENGAQTGEWTTYDDGSGAPYKTTHMKPKKP